MMYMKPDGFKKYQKPEMEIIKLGNDDVIITSCTEDYPFCIGYNPGGCPENCEYIEGCSEN